MWAKSTNTTKRNAKQTYQQASSPPWCGTLDLDHTTSHPITSDFTTEEVLISLPNNEACGVDGVTYEVLKAMKQSSIVVLIQISNALLSQSQNSLLLEGSHHL